MERKALKALLALGIVFIIVFSVFLTYMTVYDYTPKEITALTIENNNNSVLSLGEPFSVTTFNIGYCGLDKDQDFFMDGGMQSRSRSKEQTELNLEAVTKFLLEANPEIILAQEVDMDSSRSYEIDEYAYFKVAFPHYSSTFGVNYLVSWVPVPFTHPMGKVKSGLATFIKFRTDEAYRYQYPGKEKWPRQSFELDRCFIENRIPVENGKQLVLINSHLSAFDAGGNIRKQQLEYLQTHIMAEFTKGNYVIVGGDWNHVIPDSDPAAFETTESWPFWLQVLPESFSPEGFSWGVDPSVPTIRTNGKVYTEGQNFKAVIDGFLVSANVKIINVKGNQLEFENSDHNPVSAIFELQ